MEEKQILRIPATIVKVMTMADKGLRIFVDTQEIPPEVAGTVMLMKDKFGYFVFAEQIDQRDIDSLPKLELEEGEKHPSQRLRATMFVYWEQNKITEPFDIYYRRQMEKFINIIKEKLN